MAHPLPELCVPGLVSRGPQFHFLCFDQKKKKKTLRRNLLCLRFLERAATVVRTLCPGSRSLYWEPVGEDGSPLPDQPGRERKSERLREGAGKVGRGREGKGEEKRETSRTLSQLGPNPQRFHNLPLLGPIS